MNLGPHITIGWLMNLKDEKLCLQFCGFKVFLLNGFTIPLIEVQLLQQCSFQQEHL